MYAGRIAASCCSWIFLAALIAWLWAWLAAKFALRSVEASSSSFCRFINLDSGRTLRRRHCLFAVRNADALQFVWEAWKKISLTQVIRSQTSGNTWYLFILCSPTLRPGGTQCPHPFQFSGGFRLLRATVTREFWALSRNDSFQGLFIKFVSLNVWPWQAWESPSTMGPTLIA